MKTKLLFPPLFKHLGIALLVLTITVATLSTVLKFDIIEIYLKVPVLYSDMPMSSEDSVIFGIQENNISFTLLLLLSILASIFIIFSREREEDEFTSQIRLSALLWTILVNYIIYLFIIISVYGYPFLAVSQFSLFTLPIIYSLRFHYLLYKNSFYSKKYEE